MGLFGNLKSLLRTKVDVAQRFEVLHKAISGTMSAFYKARDRETGQIVGLKVCDNDKTAAFEARFKGLKKPSEGEIGAALDHPRIVKTLDYGATTTNQHFLVMEFLDGPGLNSLIVGKSPLLDGARVTLIRQAAEGLAAMHKAGYLHRDICPRNFVASKDARSLKLIDFGLSLPHTPEFMAAANRTGNPNYMAPEVVRRKKLDQRLDVYAFGASMYELLTFQLPWDRGATGQAALGHDHVAPIDIRQYRPQINPRLAQAIMKCLATSVDERVPTMDAFLQLIAGLTHEDEG